MSDAVRLAVGTLTRVPTPPPRHVDRRAAGAAMLLAPLTVLPPAVALALVHLVVATGRLPASLAAVLVVGGVAWWSRGLHLDGLADTADGLAAGFDRRRVLEVMRRGDVGPVGVVTLVLTLLTQVIAVATLLGSVRGTVLAVVALLASRQVLALGCSPRLSAARPDGLGAMVAGSVPDARLATSIVLGLLVSAGVGMAVGSPWYAGPLVLAAAVAGTTAVLHTARRRVGGVTGDVLGAVVEVSLTAGLVGAVLVA